MRPVMPSLGRNKSEIIGSADIIYALRRKSGVGSGLPWEIALRSHCARFVWLSWLVARYLGPWMAKL